MKPVSFDEMGIKKTQSHRWQRMAEVKPEPAAWIDRRRPTQGATGPGDGIVSPFLRRFLRHGGMGSEHDRTNSLPRQQQQSAGGLCVSVFCRHTAGAGAAADVLILPKASESPLLGGQR